MNDSYETLTENQKQLFLIISLTQNKKCTHFHVEWLCKLPCNLKYRKELVHLPGLELKPHFPREAGECDPSLAEAHPAVALFEDGNHQPGLLI